MVDIHLYETFDTIEQLLDSRFNSVLLSQKTGHHPTLTLEERDYLELKPIIEVLFKDKIKLIDHY